MGASFIIDNPGHSRGQPTALRRNRSSARNDELRHRQTFLAPLQGDRIPWHIELSNCWAVSTIGRPNTIHINPPHTALPQHCPVSGSRRESKSLQCSKPTTCVKGCVSHKDSCRGTVKLIRPPACLVVGSTTGKRLKPCCTTCAMKG